MCATDCMCAKCLAADLNSHLAKMGAVKALAAVNSIPTGVDYSERTRYAAPGQRVGRGIVRKVSDKQVAFMLRLFKTRDTSKLVRLPGSENIESMSLAGARDLIDRLLSCPELPNAPKAFLASEKQIKFIESLHGQKNVSAEEIASFESKRNELTSSEARHMIDTLLKADNRVVAKAGNKTSVSDGRYALSTDDGVKFYFILTPETGKWSGVTFVRLIAGDNTYLVRDPAKRESILARIADDEKAARRLYGEKIGRCGHCNRTLTDESSRAAGIGPVCASRGF
jgi:Family of unknown function (DUF6011)